MAAPSQLRLRVAALCAVCYALMFSYSLARPTTESLFIDAHTSRGLPLVWILVSLGMLACVLIYNRFVVRIELMRLFGLTALISAGMQVALMLGRQAELPGIHHLLYVWKDNYMVMLVEIFYSFANSVFVIGAARWVYGLFGAMGGLGAISGNLLVRRLAPSIGTVATLWLVVPVLLVLGSAGMVVGRIAGANMPQIDKKPGIFDALKITRRSSYLMLVLLLIALTQSVVTLVDYSFNDIVEQAYPNTDARTALVSTVYATISGSMLVLHASTGPLLRLAGVPLTLLAIPLLLGCGVGVFWLLPGLTTVAAVKVASKAFDYTLFRNAKEILYIPLSYRERTEGKSVVDMLTYRLAKGVASALLAVILQWLTDGAVEAVTLLLVAGWFVTTVAVVRRFRQKVSRDKELQ